MRRTLITGAASGIGRAAAMHLRERGHEVIGIDVAWRERDHVDLALYADLTDRAQTERALAAAGACDALVANAAITDLDHHQVVDLPIARWERIFAVNVTATVAIVQAAVRAMAARGGGNVAIVTSSLGLWKGGIPGDAVYSASKAAVEAFAFVLALETRAVRVNVNTIYPSVKVDTGFFAHATAAARTDLHPATILNEPLAFLTELPPGTLTGISLDQQAWASDPTYRARLRPLETP
jgi:NAD(P)-dependent dehydrogenase (short-subunit alcohol dehydrogenase family)